jgi:hypothetical protein
MNGKAYYWIGVGSAFTAGVISGVAGVRITLEKKLRKEFDEREQLMQHAYEQALEMGLAEKEVPEKEWDFNEVVVGIEETPSAFGEGILTVGGDIVKQSEEEKAETVNPYHRALEALETPVELFVDGGVNDYGMSYIEEEDYQDEDGRFKGKIDILINGDQDPIFMMDGQPIDDWDRRVGDSILVDFYKLVPPGTEPILYVRNHRTDEDYEVVRLAP